MAVTGTLNEISMIDLIQFNCQVGEMCRLTVENGTQVAQIYFADGTVVHTALGDKKGEEVFHEILGWESGNFELDRDLASPEWTITTHWSDLLLGGLHQLDESAHLAQAAATEHSELHELPDDLGEMFGLDKSIDFQHELEEEDNDMAGLQDTLKALSQEVTGFIATTIVGLDGLGIAGYADKSIKTDEINAQMTLLFKLVNTSIDKLGAGTVEDYLLTTDKAYLLINYLADKKYYLGIVADKANTNLGNLRMVGRIFAEKLGKEMLK